MFVLSGVHSKQGILKNNGHRDWYYFSRFDIHGSAHHDIIYENDQQDATV